MLISVDKTREISLIILNEKNINIVKKKKAIFMYLGTFVQCNYHMIMINQNNLSLQLEIFLKKLKLLERSLVMIREFWISWRPQVGSKEWGSQLSISIDAALLFCSQLFGCCFYTLECTWLVPPFLFFNIILCHINRNFLLIQLFSLQITFSNYNSIYQTTLHFPWEFSS